MSDPIERLTALRDDPATTPVVAGEAIRRRGDQIRRRRRVAVGVASIAALAAVAIPVALVAGDSSPDRVEPAPALGADVLMTDADTEYHEAGDWVVESTSTGAGDSPFNPCARGTLTDLGASAEIRRDFSWTDQTVRRTGRVDESISLTQVVGEFESAAAAEAAAAQLGDWLEDCLPSGADEYTPGDPVPVPLEVTGEARTMFSSYRPVAESIDPYGDESWLLETGVSVTGDRITVLSQLIHGQDYNWPDTETPVTRMLRAATERLAASG